MYLAQLRQLYWELRGLGVDIVGAANDTPETNREYRSTLDLPFPLLSDVDAEVAAAYGAFHENEPRDRKIALVSMVLVDMIDRGGTILWEYIAPTSRHRLAPSRLSEEVQTALGRRQQMVHVTVPSTHHVEAQIAVLHDPPMGFYTTPDPLDPPVANTQRDYVRELAMQASSEVHRLLEEGWTLTAVTPEVEGSETVGLRHVFVRTLPENDRASSDPT